MIVSFHTVLLDFGDDFQGIRKGSNIVKVSQNIVHNSESAVGWSKSTEFCHILLMFHQRRTVVVATYSSGAIAWYAIPERTYNRPGL